MTEENTSYPEAPEGSIRLNKFLASCGYESRRAADKLIAEGRVEINGKAVDTPGIRVLPTDFVKVDGRHATPKEEITILLNKPRGIVCSREAQGADGTVYDLLPVRYNYVNYVGRLDADSEGLVIMTNNGVLAQTLAHPSNGIEKEYWVTLDQNFDNSVLIQLLKGLRIPEGQAKAKYVSRLSARRACVVLEQGLKRQIRQMFSCMGLRVKKLVRVRIGSLWGGDLEPGACQVLTADEIALALKNPPKQRKLIGAKQAFKPRTPETSDYTPAEDNDDDDNYVFDPADFEVGDDDETPGLTKFSEGEAYEPEQETDRRFGRAQGPRKFDGERRSFGDRKPFGERRFGGERRSFGNDRNAGGERRSFGDRKPFGERRFDGERRSFGNDRNAGGERRSFGDRKPFGERRFDGERRSFGNDRNAGGERRSFGDRKPFGERRFDGERRSFGNDGNAGGERRSFGDRKPFGERRFDGERRSFGNDRNAGGERRSFGDRKPFGERRFDGERRSFGNDRNAGGERRSFGDRKPFGERRFDGERRSFGNDRNSGGERRSFGDRKPFGERRSFGDRPSRHFGDRPDRRFGRQD